MQTMLLGLKLSVKYGICLIGICSIVLQSYSARSTCVRNRYFEENEESGQHFWLMYKV